MIGLQQDWLSVHDFEKLKNALPDAGFKDFSSMLWRLRQVKDAAEIDAISQATKIAEIGVMTALELVSTEKSEADVSIEVESAMRKAGGHHRGIRAAVLSGTSARFPFAYPGPQRINDDVPVVIDVTVSHLGYFSEIARTIHLGKPSKNQRELFDTNLRLLEKLEEELSAHTPINELVRKVDAIMTDKSVGQNVLLPYGSAIGLDLHEPPHLIVESNDTLRPGMVISVHPTCYDEKVGCTKLSDIFVISEDGCGSISTLAREIM
jgi:Xaa-Pro aminopeptidase